MHRWLRLPAIILAGCMGAVVVSHAASRPVGLPFATRSEAMAPRAMAATSQPLATEAALEILRRGGSAVDAAIAANAVLGLTEPTGSGIGGDLFAIVWDPASGKLHGLNASGRAPRSLSLDYFRERGIERMPSYGPLPVTVPGAVDGWFELHGRFGRLPMKDVLEPAIRYARDGFPVTEVIAFAWERNVRALQEFPGFRETFMPDGRAPAKGEMFANPRLARTYETLAREGRDAFYRGDIARRIAAYMAENGGFLSYEDLAAHRSDWVEPVSTTYRGYRVWELPPNGQGIAALQMLNILEGYDIAAMGPGSADYLHVLTEAKKLVFEDRGRYYADPDFADVPVDRLISKEYAAARRALIDPERAADTYSPGDMPPAGADTVYLTVAGPDGMMVSLIQSNYRGMGSGMTPGDLGFVLQDRGEGFSLKAGHRNALEPGKRPFHTIIPAFVTRDGKPWMSFGVMGGDMQPQGHVQIIVNLVDFGMNLQEAGDAPRLQHGLNQRGEHRADEELRDGGVVLLETGFPPEVVAALRRRGHVVSEDQSGYRFGGYQAIRRDPVTGAYTGATESRKDGLAAGY
jgi:gamma-glutamyltranspeptidase/glutathione hydrolase